VGAGGLSNAFPELTNDAGRGARFDLRAVPLEESGLAPKEIWCNESQERYVMAIAPQSLEQFKPFASGSAARLPWWVWRRRNGSWSWRTRRRKAAPWTCR
jgi:phosphoribosylformylglycinamidine (FGAM) synthase-like enzyme